LSELDKKIRRTELNVAMANLKERKLIALMTTYSGAIYVVWLFSFFFLVWPHIEWTLDTWMDSLGKVMPIVATPCWLVSPTLSASALILTISIYAIRWLIKTYYRRYLTLQGGSDIIHSSNQLPLT
jgi:hypothetical protein